MHAKEAPDLVGTALPSSSLICTTHVRPSRVLPPLQQRLSDAFGPSPQNGCPPQHHRGGLRHPAPVKLSAQAVPGQRPMAITGCFFKYFLSSYYEFSRPAHRLCLPSTMVTSMPFLDALARPAHTAAVVGLYHVSVDASLTHLQTAADCIWTSVQKHPAAAART